MHHFQYQAGQLHAEELPLRTLAQRFGTPLYVYSGQTLTRHWQVVDSAFSAHPHLTCYAVKANPSGGVLQLLGRLGAGADVVSGGELFRALRAGIPPALVVYSGVGKTQAELDQALQAGIRSFHVESRGEIELLSARATALHKVAPVSVRVNPDVDAATHPYISTGLKQNKFGIPAQDAVELYAQLSRTPGLRVHGLASHIGSQITTLAPMAQAASRLVALADALQAQGHSIDDVDFGGGLGITYQDETPPSPQQYAQAILGAVGERGFNVLLEPGRVLVGNAGVLLTTVLYVKSNGDRTFVVCDAGMNDVIRPALYGAVHQVLPVQEPAANAQQVRVDLVGPVCESGDFLAKDRLLPAFRSGDLACVMTAGAYTASMASNYNSRPLAAEVMVHGKLAVCIRQRESVEDLVRLERPWEP